MAFELHAWDAHRWTRCPAAPRMSKFGTEAPRSDADEGDAAHWAASQVIMGEHADVSELIDNRDPDGHAITAEIAEHADVYIQYVQDHADMPRVEETMPSRLPGVAPVRPDVWWYDEITRTLEIVDFKYGFRPVAAFENYQLLIGANALFDGAPATIIKLTIVQPRPFIDGGPIQTWTISTAELDAQITSLFHGAVIATQDPNAPTIAGEIQCRYCSAIHCCPAARAQGLTLLDIAERGAPEFIDDQYLRNEQVQLRRAVELGKLRIDAIETHLIESIRGGAVIPGIGIGAGQGRRKWKSHLTTAQMEIAGDVSGIDLLEQKPITPAQASKAGLSDAVLAMMTTRGNTAPKIVDIDLTKKAGEVFK